MRRFTWLAALFLIPTASVFAMPAVVPAATVEAVQAPAWLDRDGRSLPLAAGMEVRNGDVLRTGPGARAYVMLAEGSRVKLGESARLALHTRSLNPRAVFRGALDIATGAFRYTSRQVTGLVGKSRQRDLAIRVGTATIGIRGTDIWGRSNAEGELVALIEGRIEITRGGLVTELAQPMSYYEAPRGREAEVKTLTEDVFRPLARQTEIETGDGAMRVKGAWKLSLGGFGDETSALSLYDRLREAGFAARIRPRSSDGTWRYEVLLTGFARAEEAEAAAVRLKALIGLEAKVVR